MINVLPSGNSTITSGTRQSKKVAETGFSDRQLKAPLRCSRIRLRAGGGSHTPSRIRREPGRVGHSSQMAQSEPPSSPALDAVPSSSDRR